MPVAEGWKVKYGVLDDSEAKRLRQLGEENRPLEASARYRNRCNDGSLLRQQVWTMDARCTSSKTFMAAILSSPEANGRM